MDPILIVFIIAIVCMGLFVAARYESKTNLSDTRTAPESNAGNKKKENLLNVKAEDTFVEYVVIDVETTGLSASTDRIVQVAAVHYRNHREVSTFCTYINPLCHIPERVTKIHGITDCMVKNAPTITDISSKLLAFIGQRLIVGYNISFDLRFLSAAIDTDIFRCSTSLDVLRYARKFIYGVSDYKLGTVSAAVGCHNRSHDALEDCRSTAAVLRYLCKGHKDEIEELNPTLFHDKKGYLSTAEAEHTMSTYRSARKPEQLALSEEAQQYFDVLKEICIKNVLTIALFARPTEKGINIITSNWDSIFYIKFAGRLRYLLIDLPTEAFLSGVYACPFAIAPACKREGESKTRISILSPADLYAISDLISCSVRNYLG